jgi:hypothetical protein
VVSERGNKKCSGIHLDLKRGDENCYINHIVNVKGGLKNVLAIG